LLVVNEKLRLKKATPETWFTGAALIAITDGEIRKS